MPPKCRTKPATSRTALIGPTLRGRLSSGVAAAAPGIEPAPSLPPSRPCGRRNRNSITSSVKMTPCSGAMIAKGRSRKRIASGRTVSSTAPEHRAAHGRGAADHHHREQRGGGEDAELLRREIQEEVRIEAAREAGEARSDGEQRDLDADRVATERREGVLVVAHRRDRATVVARHKPSNQRDRCQGQGPHDAT